MSRLVISVAVVTLTAGIGVREMQAAEDLNGARGNIFRARVDERQFELLKETVIDPQTDEGRSRHTVRWTDETRFFRVDRQNSFKGLSGSGRAHIRPLKEETEQSIKEGRKTYVTLDVTVFAPGEDVDDWPRDEGDLVVPFAADPKSNRFRGGTVTVDGTEVPVRLRGPRAQVDVRSAGTDDLLREGFWETQIFGKRDAKGNFVAKRVDLYPQTDPRTVDDPSLPRVLVVGDSISMNYHQVARRELEGVANYYRVEGNGGPSDHGVVCMELWLGDYTQEGLHWDLIQFNHGLHDLKQFYDEETETYGRYQLDIESYKANLEKEIATMRKTGAQLMWCSTTPVPNNSVGQWGEDLMGRRKDEDLVFNKAALEVLEKHPDILINDLNSIVREAAVTDEAFEDWKEGADVHFWHGPQQEVVGKAVADAIKRALVGSGKSRNNE